MSIYLIRMEPAEHFFFGTEKIGELGNRSSYYLKSMEYPQQTAILGMLRYTLLLCEGKIGMDLRSDPDVEALIGKSSFPGDSQSKFGQIKTISSVFILDKNNGACVTAPLDWNYNYMHDPSKTSYGNGSHILNYIPFLSGFKAKIGLKNELISSSGDVFPLWYEKEEGKGVLRKQVKSGNQKLPGRFLSDADQNNPEEMKKSVREAYYKQELFRMQPGFAYGCYAEINYPLDGKSFSIPFGGERSAFIVSYDLLINTPSVGIAYSNLQPGVTHWKVVLLSDTFVDEKILDLTCFAVTDTVSFRNLKTNTKETTKYSKISNDRSEDASLSDRQFILKRGSVLFFEDKNKMDTATLLIDDPAYATYKEIGYNSYQKFEIIKS